MGRGHQLHAYPRRNKDYPSVSGENLSNPSLGVQESFKKKDEAERGETTMKYLKTLFWMVAFFFAIHFSMQNREEVTLRYSFEWIRGLKVEIPEVPLFLVILCSIFFGVVIGGIGDFYKRFQLKKSLRQRQKTIEKLEKEIQALQGPGSNLPSFLQRDE